MTDKEYIKKLEEALYDSLALNIMRLFKNFI